MAHVKVGSCRRVRLGFQPSSLVRIGSLVVVPLLGACATRPAPEGIEVPAADHAFLDTVQRRTFAFFWETTNPRNGLAPDRWPDPPFSSIAAIG